MADVAVGVARAVVFDLDDTLVPWQTITHWQWAWRPQGPILSERHAGSAIRRTVHAWDRRRWAGLTGAQPPVDLATYRESVRETLHAIAGHALPPGETEAVVERFLRPAGGFDVFPDARPTVEALLASGARVGVVTQLPETIARNLMKRAELPEMPLLVHGDEASVPALPAADALRRGCKALGVKPRDARYVGDLFWSDVRAAARVGLDAVLIDRSDAWNRVTGTKIRTLRELLEPAPSPPLPPTPTGANS